MKLLSVCGHIGGYCGNEDDGKNVSWELDEETGLLVISGNGAMADYNHYMDEIPPWSSYKYDIQSVYVSQGVTSIGEEAFCEYEFLLDVVLPGSVEIIGHEAFFYCEALASVEMSDGESGIICGIGSSV